MPVNRRRQMRTFRNPDIGFDVCAEHVTFLGYEGTDVKQCWLFIVFAVNALGFGGRGIRHDGVGR